MKKIITVILISLSMITYGQSTICPGLKSLEGEWLYFNGQESIRIYLRYKECFFSAGEGGSTIANLWGWHEYKFGSTIIESNYANRFMDIPNNYDNVTLHSNSIFLSMPQCDITKHHLIGNIEDISQCNESHVVDISFNPALNQLVWHQEHSEWYGSSGCKGMTLPKKFVLTKQ